MVRWLVEIAVKAAFPTLSGDQMALFVGSESRQRGGKVMKLAATSALCRACSNGSFSDLLT